MGPSSVLQPNEAPFDLVQTTPESCFLPGTKIQFAWDSTSIGYLKTCPRLYYYVMICGYGEDEESIHLRFGREYHKALEDYDIARCNGADHEEALRKTCTDLHARTWNWVTDPETKAGKYKNKSSLMRSVIWYIEQFKDDAAKTLVLENGRPAVELSFQFEVNWGPSSAAGFNYILCGHLDRVVDYNDMLMVMDRKTTTTTLSDFYYSQFDMSNQMTLYTLAGGVILGSPIKGVCIDAAQLMVDETKFGRSFTYRTQDRLEEWLENLSVWFAQAELFAEADHWPMNDTACDKFGGCKFKGACSADPRIREKLLQTRYKQLPEDERWNPLIPR